MTTIKSIYYNLIGFCGSKNNVYRYTVNWSCKYSVADATDLFTYHVRHTTQSKAILLRVILVANIHYLQETQWLRGSHIYINVSRRVIAFIHGYM